MFSPSQLLNALEVQLLELENVWVWVGGGGKLRLPNKMGVFNKKHPKKVPFVLIFKQKKGTSSFPCRKLGERNSFVCMAFWVNHSWTLWSHPSKLLKLPKAAMSQDFES